MADSTMPRPKSGNDGVVNLKLPADWLDEAQALADEMSKPGVSLTRADALRLVIRRGLDAYHAEGKRGRK